MINGKTILNFSTSNYLGLANHPRINKKAKETIEEFGFGMASVRRVCGTINIHKELETQITKFYKGGDTVLFACDFDPNAAIFESLLKKEDCVISDELNNATLQNGMRLCKASTLEYKHRDLKDLEEKLKLAMKARIRMIATEGVFSMEGTIAPLPEIIALAKKYDAVILVDDSCATGVIGKTGKGTPEHFNVEGQIDIITSCLGKALGGSTGGYTVAKEDIINVIRHKGRPYVYSNSSSPSVIGATIETFNMLDENTDLIDNLRDNTKLFRRSLKEAGFKVIGHQEVPIAHIKVGDDATTRKFQSELAERFNINIRTMMQMGDSRLGCQVSGAHTKEQIKYTVQALTVIGKELGVITNAKL